MLLSKFGLASNILLFVLSMSWNISKNFYNVKVFCQCHFFWDIFILFITTTSFKEITSLSTPGYISEVSPMAAVSTLPRLVVYSITAFILELNFTYNSMTLLLYCTFIFVGLFPLLIIHFCKMACRYITRRQGHNTTIYFAVCGWTK